MNFAASIPWKSAGIALTCLLSTVVAVDAFGVPESGTKERARTKAPEGVIMIGEPLTVDGTGRLSSETIANTLSKARPAMEKCYAKVLRRNPAKHGRLTVRINIQGDGILLGLSVFENTAGPELERCVVEGLKGLRFPPPSGGRLIVACPFLFHNRQ